MSSLTTINDLAAFDNDEDLLEYVNDLELEHEALTATVIDSASRIRELTEYSLKLATLTKLHVRNLTYLMDDDSEGVKLTMETIA